MAMFRNILCPVDFSAHSRQSLRYGAMLASRFKSRLFVIFVEDPLLILAAGAAAYDEKALIAKLHANLERFVKRTVAPYGIQNSSLRLDVVAGQAHREIGSSAERFRCDLVVMGSHGATGATRMVLGSTTHRVLRDVQVPVLAIPPVKPGRPGPSRQWPGRWVLAPVDLGPRDSKDALASALVVDVLGAQLLLLHVVEPRDAPIWLPLGLREATPGRLLKTRAEARLEKLRARTQSVVPTACRVVTGKPAARIAAAAADSHVGLVIMTRRRGQGLFGPRQGSISYQVLLNASTPVLVLPSHPTWMRQAASRLGHRPSRSRS